MEGEGCYEIVFSDDVIEFCCEAFGGSSIFNRFLEFCKEFLIDTSIINLESREANSIVRRYPSSAKGLHHCNGLGRLAKDGNESTNHFPGVVFPKKSSIVPKSWMTLGSSARVRFPKTTLMMTEFAYRPLWRQKSSGACK